MFMIEFTKKYLPVLKANETSSVTDFIKSANRSQQYMENLRQTASGRNLKSMHFKGFVKDESYKEIKAPRVICAPDDASKLIWGA